MAMEAKERMYSDDFEAHLESLHPNMYMKISGRFST